MFAQEIDTDALIAAAMSTRSALSCCRGALQLSGDYSTSDWNTTKQQWESSSESGTFAARLDINSDKYLASLAPQITPWVGGSAPEFKREVSYSFDGKLGIEHTTKVFTENEWLSVKEAKISDGPPKALRRPCWQFGEQNSVAFAKLVGDRPRILDLLVESRNQKETPLTLETIGKNEFKITFTDRPEMPTYQDTFWITLKDGVCSLVKREAVFRLDGPPEKQLKLVYETSKQSTFNAAIAFPAEGSITTFIGGNPESRQEFRLREVQMLDESEAVFQPRIELGTVVHDTRFGVRFTAGKDISDISQDLRKLYDPTKK
jgi:hypothetical protein